MGVEGSLPDHLLQRLFDQGAAGSMADDGGQLTWPSGFVQYLNGVPNLMSGSGKFYNLDFHLGSTKRRSTIF